MDINKIILLFAIGEITRSELEQILKGIGFSLTIVDILLTKADHKKSMYASLSPSGSLGDGSIVIDVERLKPVLSAVLHPSTVEGWEQPKAGETGDGV